MHPPSHTIRYICPIRIHKNRIKTPDAFCAFGLLM